MNTESPCDLSIVGFHGTLDPLLTPAILAGVFTNATGEMVSARTRATMGVTISSDGPLPGDGTRLGPWPAQGDELVYGLSRTLAFDVRRFWMANRRPLRDIPRRWLAWALDPTASPPPDFHAEQFGGSRVLVAARDDVNDLRDLVAAWARANLLAQVHTGHPVRIRRAAWTLQRAARSRDDVPWALVAMERLDIPPGRMARLQTELLPNVTPTERHELLVSARERVAVPVEPPRLLPGDRVNGFSRDLASTRNVARQFGSYGSVAP